MLKVIRTQVYNVLMPMLGVNTRVPMNSMEDMRLIVGFERRDSVVRFNYQRDLERQSTGEWLGLMVGPAPQWVARVDRKKNLVTIYDYEIAYKHHRIVLNAIEDTVLGYKDFKVVRQYEDPKGLEVAW